MCELCGSTPQESKMARLGCRSFANSLRWLAVQYERLADGKVDPHTEEWSKNKPTANNIIRNLVNDWV
jgi:hypothetical protein